MAWGMIAYGPLVPVLEAALANGFDLAATGRELHGPFPRVKKDCRLAKFILRELTPPSARCKPIFRARHPWLIF
jgi:hypothetical protein